MTYVPEYLAFLFLLLDQRDHGDLGPAKIIFTLNYSISSSIHVDFKCNLSYNSINLGNSFSVDLENT